LLADPIREVYLRIADARGFEGHYLPYNFVLSTSLLYELVERGAQVFGSELGYHYLRTQGDIWDDHKDMILGSIGALIAMIIFKLINYSTKRDFSRE
jgi:putative membrane protein